MTERGVVVVARDASPTTEVAALLDLLGWLRAERDLDPVVVLHGGGDRLDEVRALARVQVAGELRRPPADLVERVLFRLGATARASRRRGRRLGLQDHDGPYVVHDPFAMAVVRCLPPTAGAVCRLPDVGAPFATVFSARDRRTLLRRCRRFVVDNPLVARELVDDHGIDASRVTVSPFVVAPPAATDESDGLRSAMGVADGTPVVAAVGPRWPWRTPWEQGRDLFVRLAGVVGRTDARVHFAWVGASPDDTELSTGEREDVAQLGLADRFHSVLVDDVASAARHASVLVLPARAPDLHVPWLDELLASGIPAVTFEGAAAEDRLRDAGLVVPPLDLATMADLVVGLLDDGSATRRALAEQTADRHRQRWEPVVGR